MSQLFTSLSSHAPGSGKILFGNTKAAICSTQFAPSRHQAAFISPAFATDDITRRISEVLKPGNRSQIAFGSAVGFATGYAIKRVGQMLLVIVGLEVIALQLMANHGWVVVNWPLITRDLSPHVKKGAVDRVIEAVQLKLPFAGSFTAGCYAGLNWS